MVEFHSDYWSAMKRKPIETINMSVKELGVSAKMGDVLQTFRADITAGASHVELGFTGMAKGNLGQTQTTPEMFNREKRREIRRLSKLNHVGVSTHASLGIQGLSGLDTQHNRFSDTKARETLNELKRTIDFAGEAAGGGAVVVHTGEFPREVSEFEQFMPKEEIKKEEIVVLVDRDTGKFVNVVNKGEVIYAPELTKQGDKYVDIMGNPTDDPIKALPIIDEDGNVKFKKKVWDNYVEEAKELRKKEPKKFEGLSDSESAAKLMFLEKHRAELERAKPFASHYYENFKATKKHAEELLELKEQYKNAEKGGDIGKIKKHLATSTEIARLGIRYDPYEDGKPSDFLVKKAREYEIRAKSELEGFQGYAKQIKEVEEMNEKVEPISKEGKIRTANNIAEAALYAIRKEESLKKQGVDVKPIFIAPENLFPEGGYGAHPDELKDIVLSSRARLVEELKKQGRNSEEAKNIADEHIRATFDIGHAYTWKKFFKEDPKKSMEENEKDFQKWLLKKVDELNEKKIIGHVHLSDNFGYYDEHLTPGTGSAPINEFVERMKKAGLKEPMIVEWGAQSTEHEPYGAMLGAWARLASSPVYRIDGIQQSWSDVEHSGYFGRTSSPNFIIGKYGPSKDWAAWGWSEAPIE